MLFPLKKRISVYKAGMNAWRTNPVSGKRFRHNGQDYRARYEPIYAPLDGIVRHADSALGGIGLEIDGGEYKFIVRHLSKVLRLGPVKWGEQIGVSGATGKVTVGKVLAPHLHLEVIKTVNY